MKNMKFKIIFVFLSIIFTASAKQEMDSVYYSTRYGICFVPSTAKQLNGLTLGLSNMPDIERQQQINGIQFELIGKGWETPFVFMDDGRYFQKSRYNLQNNGLLFGTTLLAGKINGAGISPFIITNHDLNGLLLAPVTFTIHSANGVVAGVFNYSHDLKGIQFGFSNTVENMNGTQLGIYNRCFSKSKGLQFGLINRSDEHDGIQIGLINKIGKRITPFINWHFDHKKLI